MVSDQSQELGRGPLGMQKGPQGARWFCEALEAGSSPLVLTSAERIL